MGAVASGPGRLGAPERALRSAAFAGWLAFRVEEVRRLGLEAALKRHQQARWANRSTDRHSQTNCVPWPRRRLRRMVGYGAGTRPDLQGQHSLMSGNCGACARCRSQQSPPIATPISYLRPKRPYTVAMISKRCPLLVAVMLVLTAATAVRAADPAPFDLAGPIIQATVTRDGKTLPISQVPNLAAGDHLWIKANLPLTQSAHYIMVAAFLRGATNPPPANWFFLCETWSRQCAQSGLELTVPQDAQQVMLFLAPETGGDYKTLVNAVRGRPGAFVRASQDLNQATLDRSRLELYLAAVRALADSDPAKLKDAAPLLARSLAIKVDDKCLDRTAELQAACLMQGQNSLILNDGHSTSIVEALTSGPASDLAMEASFTPQLSYGLLQPLHRIGDRYRPHPGLLSYSAVSVHSSAGIAAGRPPRPVA